MTDVWWTIYNLPWHPYKYHNVHDHIAIWVLYTVITCKSSLYINNNIHYCYQCKMTNTDDSILPGALVAAFSNTFFEAHFAIKNEFRYYERINFFYFHPYKITLIRITDKVLNIEECNAFSYKMPFYIKDSWLGRSDSFRSSLWKKEKIDLKVILSYRSTVKGSDSERICSWMWRWPFDNV